MEKYRRPRSPIPDVPSPARLTGLLSTPNSSHTNGHGTEAPALLPTKNVVVVFDKAGAGHETAGKALAQALEKEGNGRVHIQMVDAADHTRRPIKHLPEVYNKLLVRYPFLWRVVFDGTNTRWTHDPARSPIGYAMISNLTELITRTSPHLIVSVAPGFGGILDKTLHAQKDRPRLEVVATDLANLHRSWVPKNPKVVDHYTVPTPAAKKGLVRFGVPAGKIDVVGIPIRDAFASYENTPEKRKASRKKLGLHPEHLTILAILGSTRRSIQGITALSRLPLPDTQMIIVCGKHARAQKNFERHPTVMEKKVLGYVNNMPELMGASDIVVTKAGGVTLSESLAMGNTIVTFDPLYGQEQHNVNFAQEHGALLHAETPEELTEHVVFLASHPDHRTQLSKHASELGNPHAASEIAQNMLNRLNDA